MFDNGSKVTVVKGGTIYGDRPLALPVYEQFKLSGPSCQVFGADGLIMLRDALESLFRHGFSKYVVSLNQGFDINKLMDTIITYARIYYRCEDKRSKDGVMQMMRSVIVDYIRDYKPQQEVSTDINSLAEGMFTSVKELIESGS